MNIENELRAIFLRRLRERGAALAGSEPASPRVPVVARPVPAKPQSDRTQFGAIAMLAVMFGGVLLFLATCAWIDSTRSAAPSTTSAPLNQAAWADAYAKGRELGATAGLAGWGVPTEAALEGVAEIHAQKTSLSGADREFWKRGLKSGYRDAYKDVTKKAW